jgi:hypothetical protein
MYQPYPDAAQMPADQRPPAPAPVRRAVMVMYAGAAASLLRAIADLVTRTELNSFVAARSRAAAVHLTASQTSATTNAALAVAVVIGIIGVGLWIFIARAAGKGSKAARVTGTVLFGLDTLALLVAPPDVGLSGPVLPKIFTVVVWLAGLVVVILLWLRSSRAFFRGE